MKHILYVDILAIIIPALDNNIYHNIISTQHDPTTLWLINQNQKSISN